MVLLVIFKVGLYISEFYSSLYAVYVASGDPAIAATLTFIHWMVSTTLDLCVK